MPDFYQQLQAETLFEMDTLVLDCHAWMCGIPDLAVESCNVSNRI